MQPEGLIEFVSGTFSFLYFNCWNFRFGHKFTKTRYGIASIFEEVLKFTASIVDFYRNFQCCAKALNINVQKNLISQVIARGLFSGFE
jgi:hypothetical protein